MNKAFEKILDRLEEELIPLNQEITKYFYELKDTDNPKLNYTIKDISIEEDGFIRLWVNEL